LKPGSSPKKGGNYERDICKKLSLWWTNGEDDNIFWRTSSSGARATQRTKRGKKTFGGYGDITAVDPRGQPLLDKFVFSLKNGYSRGSRGQQIDILHTLDKLPNQKTVPKFIRFWKEIAKLANDNNKSPLLIFKRDFGTDCIAFSYTEKPKIHNRKNYIDVSINHKGEYISLRIMTLKDFFSSNKKEDFCHTQTF
jgi:hypothetical protein